MFRSRFAALIICAVIGAAGMSSCSKKSSSESDSGSSVSTADWELITPAESDEEYTLGSYRIDPETGIKLYYNEEEFPRELAVALERHFIAFQDKDFDSFQEQNHPIYNEEMEKFLQEGFQYGLKESFEKQADSISESCGGSFEVTRVKIEPSVRFATEEEGIEDFLTYMGEVFSDEEFGGKVRDDADDIFYFTFYVMAKDVDGVETGIVNDYQNNTMFVLKDGKYYSFG